MNPICIRPKKKCWNLIDSYGEFCVGCGCCAEDKKIRYENRIRILEKRICEQINFNYYSEIPEVAALQEYNVKSNIKTFSAQYRYYRTQLRKLEAKND